MVTLPTEGQEDWDVPLNAALNSLQDEIDAHEAAADPHGAKAYGDTTFRKNAVFTADGWLTTTPVLVAHRGSGAEFPEHTVTGYEAAVSAGVKAIEVSVHLSADGIPVCFHDTTLDRMTDAAGDIDAKTYSELRETVNITPQGQLGAGWSNQPINTLREVLDQFLGRVIIFLEAKSNDSIPVVQDMLQTFYPHASRSVVWKGYYTNNSFPTMRSRGFKTWGYFFGSEGVTDLQLDAVDADVDIWGPQYTETDARLGEIINRGKPVIVHVADRNYQVDRINNLGATGAMCTTAVYVTKDPVYTADRFDTQISSPGILPFTDNDPVYALQYDGAGGAYTGRLSGEATCMAQLKAPADSGYKISYAMKWGTLPATTSQHADIVFGKTSDDRFKYFATDNDSAGYTAFHRATGEIALYTHTPGSSSSTQLGTLATEAPVAGTYMTFELEVTATQVIFRRTDKSPTIYTLTVNDTQHRGRYWHLGNGSVTDQIATWKDFSIVTV